MSESEGKANQDEGVDPALDVAVRVHREVGCAKFGAIRGRVNVRMGRSSGSCQGE